MLQQINLYQLQYEDHTYERFLTWEMLLKSMLVIACLMGLSAIHSLYTLFNAYHEKNALASIIDARSIAYNTEKDRYPAFLFSQNAEKALQELKDTVAKQSQILELISQQKPFTNFFTTLSQSIVPNVWLTSIEIEKSGLLIKLTGNAYSMAKLNDFLGNLTNSPTLTGATILADNIVQVAKDDANNLLEFHISIERQNA